MLSRGDLVRSHVAPHMHSPTHAQLEKLTAKPDLLPPHAVIKSKMEYQRDVFTRAKTCRHVVPIPCFCGQTFYLNCHAALAIS